MHANQELKAAIAATPEPESMHHALHMVRTAQLEGMGYLFWPYAELHPHFKQAMHMGWLQAQNISGEFAAPDVPLWQLQLTENGLITSA